MTDRPTEQPNSGRLSWISRLRHRYRTPIRMARFAVPFLLGIVVAWYFWGNRSPVPADEAMGEHVHTASQSDGSDTLWTCSMHPQIRATKPGKCPICGMDLIPVSKTTSSGIRAITFTPEALALMGVEVAPVERRYVTHTIPMVGKVDYDETRLAYITAWVSGRLERLFADFTGVQVRQGDHMVRIYSEELYSAQEELLQALRYRRQRTEAAQRSAQIDLVQAAREKLRLLGLSEEQIQEIESRGTPSYTLTINAPAGGIVVQKLKQEGERVQLGDRIYTIADLTRLWVHLDAYEADLPWVRYGQDVTIETEALPGEQFHGRIAFIQPVLDDRTRTVKVRVNVPNEDGKLKPQMFVHAVVRPKVAAGGRVLDPELAGKWISPMHPEIIKDQPGLCDICGMPLVRAETLGYVAAEVSEQAKPLVVPYSAALLTGTRAVVYVRLPAMHSAAEPAWQTLSTVVAEADLAKARNAFGLFAKMLSKPYDQPGTQFAIDRWNEFADRLTGLALQGERATDLEQAREVLAQMEATMERLREAFAPPDTPTFEGREIVLGPRAGDYFLVRHGLAAGELVVANGAFKVDAEIQLQAKPSMMTPEGGGGAGHAHAGHGGTSPAKKDHAGHAEPSKMELPAAFRDQLTALDALAEGVHRAIQVGDLTLIHDAFSELAAALQSISDEGLSGHPRMMWRELSMLLMNDAVEGKAIERVRDADRVYIQLSSHLRRLRQQFNLMPPSETRVVQLQVPAPFVAAWTDVLQAYARMQSALAQDDLQAARAALAQLRTAVAQLPADQLADDTKRYWDHEVTNLSSIIQQLEQTPDLEQFRTRFALLSEEMSVLVRALGAVGVSRVYQYHCPMALGGRGAIWLQVDQKVRNPYFGSTMLGCYDRVEPIELEKLEKTE